jgi:hypothetical protein
MKNNEQKPCQNKPNVDFSQVPIANYPCTLAQTVRAGKKQENLPQRAQSNTKEEL